MKKIILISILIAFTGLTSIIINKGGKEMTANGAEISQNQKVLVAYFSRTGEQYSVGTITEGNTAIIAKMIAEKTNGDLFEIKVAKDEYPMGYIALTQYAKKEKDENARPEIIGKVENFDDYDVVFIGYPNWWADMPMPVYTFMESYDFSNKKVYHFCTHEGSGGVKPEGFAIYGHIAQKERKEADKKVSQWLKTL